MKWLEVSQADSVAILWLNRRDAKVNTILPEMLEECAALLQQIDADDTIKAIIITSSKRDFGVGADLEAIYAAAEHGEAETISRRGHELLLQIEQSKKPVVAAIKGAAVGGGLEILLACHYRIAAYSSHTVFGFPEVTLGLLPGGGATQRLPKLIGIRAALYMMLRGKNISASKALSIGLIDRLVHPAQLMPYAIKQALHLAERRHIHARSLSPFDRLVQNNRFVRGLLFDRTREKLLQHNFGNYPAPFKILECIEIGCHFGTEMGNAAEITKFDELAVHPVTKQLIRLFFEAGERRKNPLANEAQNISNIAVIGAGLTGGGITELSVLNGLRVTLTDINPHRSAKTLQRIWRRLSGRVRKKSISPIERWQIMNRVSAQTGFENLEQAEMVIEAAPENLQLKQQILARFEAVAPQSCIFASTTSSIPIAQIAEHSSRPEQVIGMHYLSPVSKVSLLEIAVIPQTSSQTLAAAINLGIAHGKTCIVVKDSPGFYTTRIMAPYLNEALVMLEEGGDIWQIDECARQLGFAVGPFSLIDNIGIDALTHVLEGPLYAFFRRERGAGAFTPSGLPRLLLNAGLEGRKNRRGFYRYDERTGKKKEVMPDNQVYHIINQNPRREWFKDKQVRQRLLMCMNNEAVKCLEDNILQSVSDGNVGAVLGLGYPAYTGGPFSYLDAIGCSKAIIRLENLARRYGNRFLPSPLLYDYAKKGIKFSGS
ncbi:hypothetical protein C7N43_31935 [Sphingobacteriales bacterium UPWRP_1]|nr:hypothetical protein BVG80_01435 [Sphingobacteriales bacterium TSM_CSM]PSJ72873.1 hypothetical protein C7N43_31935 [Sphingobacteriales bacterium UPWRP_1]